MTGSEEGTEYPKELKNLGRAKKEKEKRHKKDEGKRRGGKETKKAEGKIYKSELKHARSHVTEEEKAINHHVDSIKQHRRGRMQFDNDEF